MKRNILLINCYREEAEIKIAGYHAWLKAGAAATGCDLDILTLADREILPDNQMLSGVIVSGSQKMVGAGEVEPGLLEFLLKNRRPLLGICYGHQVLARAFGCLVKKDGQKHLGDEEILIKKAQSIFSAFPPVFKMRQSHEEIVARDPVLEGNFHVLAHNASGRVEAIVHREYPLYGVQFHPEKSGEFGVKLLVNFLNILK
ncbi:MAG: gamma-glutamyl-gamma-aminobutyrate hydrolase family protein [Candidatus Aminicenantes bacterium]|nr:gamma-glutamyl-gamma-aminobutyrate hydrolase family protein [Candidatus Aminicenantes bacterium]